MKYYTDKEIICADDRKTFIAEARSEKFAQKIVNALNAEIELAKRIQDLEQGILRFQAHLEEYGGNYTQDELWKLINLASVDRPYFPPVSYHDNWTGKETSTEND